MENDRIERIRRNAERLARLEDLVLEDVINLFDRANDDYVSPITDTARGQLLKFLQSNGFDADITNIPTKRVLNTGLTPEDLVDTGEPEW